jgi:hypothetical protein
MKQVGKSNWYELSDGSKVQGKANAEAAEAAANGTATASADVAPVVGSDEGQPETVAAAPVAEV